MVRSGKTISGNDVDSNCFGPSTSLVVFFFLWFVRRTSKCLFARVMFDLVIGSTGTRRLQCCAALACFYFYFLMSWRAQRVLGYDMRSFYAF